MLTDTPRKADWRIQIVSLLWNYAKLKADWPLGDDPAKSIDLYSVQNPFEPWPEWMVEKLPDAPETVQTAAELILGSGRRPGAAIEMAWEDFTGDRMTVMDKMQDERFDVHCPDQLRTFLDSVPKRGAHVLAKNLREPLGYDAVERGKWRKDLGANAKGYSLHGLRKLAIIRLAEAGWFDAEIQAATNQSMETVAYYRKKASRLVLTQNARKRRRQSPGAAAKGHGIMK